MVQASSKSWKKIFDDYHIPQHIFENNSFYISADKIKLLVKTLKKQAKKKFAYYVHKLREKIAQIFLKKKGYFYCPSEMVIIVL